MSMTWRRMEYFILPRTVRGPLFARLYLLRWVSHCHCEQLPFNSDQLRRRLQVQLR